jgi:hypothetical protein
MPGRLTKAEYEKAIGRELTNDEYGRLTMATDDHQSREHVETKTGVAATETSAINAAAPKSAQAKDAKKQAWNASPGTNIGGGYKVTDTLGKGRIGDTVPAAQVATNTPLQKIVVAAPIKPGVGQVESSPMDIPASHFASGAPLYGPSTHNPATVGPLAGVPVTQPNTASGMVAQEADPPADYATIIAAQRKKLGL